MINFYDLTFRRVILHEIVAKQDGMEHGTVIPDENLFTLTDMAIDLIKERIYKASQSSSKAFELEIFDFAGGSFFGNCHNLKALNDTKFVEASISVAHLLAESQKKNTIPGGYLIFVEAFTKTGKTVYMAIKAELHKALRYEVHNQESYIKIFDDIFLSPSQKFFKIGLIYEKDEIDEDLKYPNNEYGCFFYDSQFGIDSKPAEYFYRDFLGFTTEKNAKIQSKRFYDNTYSFINKNIPQLELKNDLINVLKNEFTTNDEPEVKPLDFARMYFNDDVLNESYANEVATYLPNELPKDTSLIKAKLEKKKIAFPNKITISGPDNTFDYSVHVIKSKSELEELDLENEEITVIKINGRPSHE